jgi:hypothetical protein
LAAALSACAKKTEAPKAQPETPVSQPAAVSYDTLARPDFNRLAAERDLPLFWLADKNQNKRLDPEELRVVWGVAPPAEWLANGAFTEKFAQAYADLVRYAKSGAPTAGLAPEELARRASVLKELAQGRPSLIAWDFTTASEQDRALVKHVVAAANHIEALYAAQRGLQGMREKIPQDDPASHYLFYRNQGPWCEAPQTQNDKDCSALPSRPVKRSGEYPLALQDDAKFCDKLAARKDGKALLDPFVVVQGSELQPVPYTVAYKDEMTAVANELRAAAEAITSTDEAPLKTYLLADAQAFLDNNWLPADEAWAKMSVKNSRWYLRIAPDETYGDPCSQKAGFQVSFARINLGSLKWQDLLDPVKNDMEKYLAAAAGKPYKARNVSFHLPDFIDIVLNAGDSRPASGATIGESLPNFGPVANEGRGRTVAMTNLYTDPDSIAEARTRAESIFGQGTIAQLVDSPEPLVMTTVLHEAAHNLGPAHQYKAGGKTDSQAFGGPLAAMLEELKAQTAAWAFTDWLVERKMITRAEADHAHVLDVLWNFGHIAQGFYEKDGKLKPYSALSGIQVGFLLGEGALTFAPQDPAANGSDKGALTIHFDKFPAAAKKLLGQVAHIKATGDKKAAEAMVAKYLQAGGETKAAFDLVTERVRRSPRASFSYSIAY